MANNKKQAIDVITITETQQRAIEEKITTIRSAMDNSVFDLAPLVRELSEGKAHLRDGYSNFKEYISDKLNIGASSAMNMIALSKRFSEGGSYVIPDKWRDFGFAKLQILKPHTNTEIAEKGITPDMSVNDIIDVFKPALTATEPEKTEPETNEPETNEPETTEPETTEPENPEKNYATISLNEILDGLTGNKDKRDTLAKWLKEQATNGLQYVYIELGK